MSSLLSAVSLVLSLGKRHSANGSVCSADDKEMISRLKFIGKINKNEKINTYDICVQPNNVWTSLSRTLVGVESKETTFSFIRITVDRVFGILEKYNRMGKQQHSFPEYNDSMRSNLIQDLNNSLAGLTNIKSTYREHIKFCCDLETIIQEITSRVGDLGIDS
jgi:hypothetical protein